MKQIELKWIKVDRATGYLLRLKKLSDNEVIDKDVGNIDQYTLELNEPSDYEWSIYPYNETQTGRTAEKRIIKVVEAEPLDVVELISPETGITIEIEAETGSGSTEVPLCAYGYSPSSHSTIDAEENTTQELSWSLFNLPHNPEIDGVKIYVKRNGTLVVDGEEVTNLTSYTLDVLPSSEYEWWVVTYNSFGQCVNPPIVYLTTEEATVRGDVILPPIHKSPPIGYEGSASNYGLMNLNWEIDGLSKLPEGTYINIKRNGELIVDKEEVEGTNYKVQMIPESTYEWQVILYDSDGEVEGNWWTFSTNDDTQIVFPTVQIGGVASKETNYDLPISVERFYHINKFEMYITYSTTGVDIGDCVGVTLNPELTGDVTLEHLTYTGWTGGKLMKISWEQPESQALSDGSDLVTLHFERTGGSSTIGFSQVSFFNKLRNPDEYLSNFYNDGNLLDYSLSQGIHGKIFGNGWINTAIGLNDVPLPLNPVNMTPHQGGGTVYKFTEPEKEITIKWMPGNPPRPIGWKVSVKEDGILIVDKEETTDAKFNLTVKPDLTYEFQIIPYNENGECQNNEWFTFKTETLVILDAPIATIGTVVSDESTSVVPITVENFNNIGACDLQINYDPEIINCTHVTLGDGVGATMWMGGPTESGVINISWLLFTPGPDGPIGLTLPDGSTMFNLHFSKINGVIGTSSIEFDLSHPLYNEWYNAEAEQTNDVPQEDFYINGSITQEGGNVSEIPESVDIITPLDGAVNVGSILNGKLMANFKWQPSNTASGYKLYIGESVEFENPIDVGNTMSKRMELNFETTYFWKIVPYNSFGDAENCPVHSFTTMDSDFNHTTTIQEPVADGDSFKMDVTVNDFTSVGAISLTLGYENDIVNVQGVTLNSDIDNATWNDTGNEVKLGWLASSESEVLNLPEDTLLFTVHFDVDPSYTETSFTWNVEGGMCEYAGYGGAPVYSDAVFNDLTWQLP